MRQFPTISVDDDDAIECFAQHNPGSPAGDPVIAIRPDGGHRYRQSLTLMPSWDALRRMGSVIGRLLEEHDELFGRGHVTPAEACCGAVIDTDDLLHAMSMGFELRGEDFDDPTPNEIAAGVRNAPRSNF
jgi:hypothetical protein